MKKNDFVIVRGNRSGVFYGELDEFENNQVCLKNCRRIYFWEGACSISQLAKEGTKSRNCKISVPVDELIIMDAIEILKCTDKAILCLGAYKEWKI